MRWVFDPERRHAMAPPFESRQPPLMAALTAIAPGAEEEGAREHGRDLFMLRNVLIGAEIIAVAIPGSLLGLSLPVVPIAVALSIAVLLNILTWQRLRTGPQLRERELCAHVLADVTLLTVVLHFAGGTTNPFADLYFVPLAFAAAALPLGYGLTIATVTTIGHWALGLFSDALAAPALMANKDLWLGSIYLSDFLSAALIAYVVYQVAASLRRHERLLAQAREKELNDKRLVELGAMATGAAHELGSPLSTVAVLLHELQRSYKHVPALCDDLRLMESQIHACKETLTTMLASTGNGRVEGGGAIALDEFIDGVVQRWKNLRPAATVRLRCHGVRPAPRIVADLTLEQAVVNLLNNAADASPDDVELDADWDEHQLRLCVSDRGHGIDAQTAKQLGIPFFTTRSRNDGKGLGVFLTATTVQRFGGRFSLHNRASGGAEAEMLIPLAPISVSCEPPNGHAT